MTAEVDATVTLLICMRGTPIDVSSKLPATFAEIIRCFPEILVGIQNSALKQAMTETFQSLLLTIHGHLPITHDIQCLKLKQCNNIGSFKNQ
jgi:hypothetical protein